jgi:hypothetical protein
MSFQFVIDNASSISINRRPVISSTLTRNGTVKNVSRGGAAWVFDVTLPSGPSWEQYRPFISLIEKLDQFTPDIIKLNNPGHTWLSKYQGNEPNPAIVVNGTTTSDTVSIVSGVTISSGFIFKAGDFIQIGNRVYTVAQDVAWNQSQIKLHRPVLDEPASRGNQLLKVGPNCEFRITCVQFPQWNIFERNQVNWSGPFVFREVGYIE